MNTQSDRGWAAILGAAVLVALAATTASAQQTFNVLVNFNGNNGGGPIAALTQDVDGDLYGTTSAGLHWGTFFKLTTAGTLNGGLFDYNDGADPRAALIQAFDGNLYGTTESGGNNRCYNGCGTIFAITPERAD